VKLLFNTTTTAGNTELKDLLGFIDADLKLKKLIQISLQPQMMY
jgi:hypothetical protein